MCIRDSSGLDLSADKQYLIESRLLPLSRKCGLPGISDLVQKMRNGSSAIIAQVVEAMTTNETFFFRDKVPFDHFRDSIVPEIMKARASRKSIRIWCAAGSTGQEPYSLAKMCIRDRCWSRTFGPRHRDRPRSTWGIGGPWTCFPFSSSRPLSLFFSHVSASSATRRIVV